MKTIGVVGGLGPESTAAYYCSITRKYYELRGDYAYPEILIYSLDFKEIIDLGYEAAPKIRAAIEALQRAGADFAVAACNSIHIVYEELRDDLPIPWVSIMAATAEEIARQGMRKVGLLGTVFTMSKGFYQRGLAEHGIDALTPDPDAQKRVNDIIFDELITATITEESKNFVLGCIDELAALGAEGIVLGCTELPFLIQQPDTELRVFDTTDIHAQKALDFAMSEED